MSDVRTRLTELMATEDGLAFMKAIFEAGYERGFQGGANNTDPVPSDQHEPAFLDFLLARTGVRQEEGKVGR